MLLRPDALPSPAKSRGTRTWQAVVALAVSATAAACSCPPPHPGVTPAAPVTGDQRPTETTPVDPAAERAAIDAVVDGWHAAAARADEDAYFAAMTDGAIFLGTDATERWDKPAFRAYAHPHFAKGKAWSFEATRRDVILSEDGELAWFDEDLATPNLGPARGSGVLRKDDGTWRIAHYNLTITVPNERFDEVKSLLEQPGGDVKPSGASDPESPPRDPAGSSD